MKLNFLKSAVLVGLFSITSCKVPVPGTKLSQKEICGRSQCKPGNIGTSFIYDDDPYSIGDVKDTSPDEIAKKILGRKVLDNSGLSYRCSESGYIDKNHINSSGPVNVKYSKESEFESNIDLNVMVDNSIDALSDLDLSDAEIQAIKGELDTYYNSIKNKNVYINAKYYDYFINMDGEDAFDDGTYDNCLNETGDFSVITAIGLIDYEVKIGSESIDDFNLNVDLEYDPKVVEAKLESSIKNNVTKNLELEFPGTYQIIFMRYATKSQLDRT